MKPIDKEFEMRRFVKGETQIMVATTVIEVGVNVPNASVMVIENAERFGLAQLHQLRGRVGRGVEQSYCILMSDYKLSKEAKLRIDTMVKTNNGFEIADVDLKIRGPGDLTGTQQSGVLDLLIADLATDGKILSEARSCAEKIIDIDPKLDSPNYQILKRHIISLKKVMLIGEELANLCLLWMSRKKAFKFSVYIFKCSGTYSYRITNFQKSTLF